MDLRYEEAWFNFHRYDKDGSGTIDMTELAGLLGDLRLHVGRAKRTEEQMQQWVARELHKSDANGDGVLSFEEFLAYYNSFVARHRSQCDELYSMTDEELGRVSQETLLLYGERSSCLAVGDRLQGLIHGARLETLEGGHYLAAERAPEVGRLIKEFLDG